MHALVTADTIGGVWTYVRELVTGLIARGVRVTLVSFGEIPSPQQMAWMGSLEGLDYRPTGFRLEWMQDAEEDIDLSSEYLEAIVREVRPDILHLNQFCYGSLGVDVPRIVVAHSDVLSWWVAVHGEEPRDNRWFAWYRETVRRGLASASAVVAPSQWMLNAISAYEAQPAIRKVIHNGRDPNLFNPHITKQRYAVSVGRLWDGAKQVGLLTHIDPALPVHVAGSQRHPEAPSQVRGDGGSSKVYFKGVQSQAQLRHLYGRACMYIATSCYEPFGLAPLEAALSRCALIMNNIPSFHEIWGDSAVYFDLNDPGSLEKTISDLASNEDVCRDFANRAYAHARANYTTERMTDAYLGLYESVVAAEAAAA